MSILVDKGKANTICGKIRESPDHLLTNGPGFFFANPPAKGRKK